MISPSSRRIWSIPEDCTKYPAKSVNYVISQKCRLIPPEYVRTVSARAPVDAAAADAPARPVLRPSGGNPLRQDWSIRYNNPFTIRVKSSRDPCEVLKVQTSHSVGVTPPASTTTDDPDLSALRAYWTGKCFGRAMPRRTDINPREIPSLLPHMMILEIHEPLRFCFRLVGTKICERWGDNHTGKWLDELDYDGVRRKR